MSNPGSVARRKADARPDPVTAGLRTMSPRAAGTRHVPARVSIALLLLSSLSGLGCNATGLTTRQFVARVDSISAPDTIAATSTLRFQVWGTLGPDLCSRLESVEKRRFAGGIELRFRGARTSGGNCAQMPAALRYEETITPPIVDPFTIRVLQPDGASPLERQVRSR